ncbi:hypothetical protein B0I35DRAFT_515116 [Stachybotrys elegans]|uniref:Uncharacterized protein n=1 Tax=Stachybotrys elegans TaxID=80388 RepID=A0A8K0WLW2_9HYPO|nr:hypothetical protein B0I35DRAFT_515116 [Stachybotrys elegans]
MVSFKTIALLATSALAAPVSERQVSLPDDWAWSVEGWEAGCTRTCYYRFNVTIPSIEGVLGAKAFCSGGETNDRFLDCQILSGANNPVAAKLLARPENMTTGFGPQEFAVSFQKSSYEGSPTYNFTAYNSTTYNAVSSPPMDFKMKPTEVFGIL